MTSHSKFSPSKAQRWLNCPGSASLEALVPPGESSIWAIEGTAAHLLCEARLKETLTAVGLTQTKGKKIKEIFPNQDNEEIVDVVITEEMINAVQEYDLIIRSYGKELKDRLVEQRVHFEDTNIFGTADCLVRDWPECLHVFDFKFGAGVAVDVIDNLQLIIYGCAALDTFGSDYDRICIHVIQPRTPIGDSHKFVSYKLSELEPFRTKIREAIKRCNDPDAPLIPGDWCHWCMACSNGCEVAKDTMTTIIKRPEYSIETPEVISEFLDKEKAVLEFYKQLKAKALALLNQGVVVPGYKLVETFGHSKWIDEDEVREVLEDFELDLIEQRKLLSPNQMKKSLGKSYPTELKTLITRPSNGLVLAPESDKRPAAKRIAATDDFQEEIE